MYIFKVDTKYDDKNIFANAKFKRIFSFDHFFFGIEYIIIKAGLIISIIKTTPQKKNRTGVQNGNLFVLN